MTGSSPSPVDGEALHRLILARRSLRAYDSRPVEAPLLRLVLEAARWAASCYNEQPWRYIVADRARQPEAHAKLAAVLVPSNRVWAEAAPVLLLAVAKTSFSHNEAANRHASHDLGQASAQLALQAVAVGLMVHQMGGFDAAAARSAFGVPEGYDPVAAIALGYPGQPERLPPALREREQEPAVRKPLDDVVFAGQWQGGPI